MISLALSHLGRDPTNGQTLGSIVNLGTVIAEGGNLSLYGNVTGPGTIAVRAGATLTQYAGAVQTPLLEGVAKTGGRAGQRRQLCPGRTGLVAPGFSHSQRPKPA